MSITNNNKNNKDEDRKKQVNEISGKNKFEHFLYTMTADEQDSALLISNSTGRYNRTPDYTAISKIDPRYLGLDYYSDYFLDTQMLTKFYYDKDGNIRLSDIQIVEPNPEKTEELFGRRIFNNYEKGINGTADLRVYSNNASENINNTNYSRRININTNQFQETKLFGKTTPPPVNKLNITVHVDDITRDYNTITNETHKDFITNSREGRPVEIDKKISEIFTFYTSEQYATYLNIQKAHNPNYRGFEQDNLPKGMSYYEAQLITKDVSKFLVMDTKLFQSTGEKTVDSENFLRNVGTEELELIKEYENKKIDLYKKYKEVFLSNNPQLKADGSNLMEVKRVAMYVAESVQNNAGYIKECTELEAELMEKLNPSFKKEIEEKIQQIESVPRYKDSSIVSFDLNERLEKIENNQKYLNAINNWTSFKPEFSQSIIDKHTKNGLFNEENAIRDVFSDMGLNDYYRIRQLSREELIIRWEKLATNMSQLVPTASTTTSIDYGKGMEIENTAKAMSLLKDIILTHPDNNKAFEFNPYSTGDIDKIPLDLTTYYALEKLKSIKGLDKNQFFEEITTSTLMSRQMCMELQEKLVQDTKQYSFNINGKQVSLQSLLKDKSIEKDIENLVIESKICSPAELANSIRELSDKIEQNNATLLREAELTGDSYTINATLQPLRIKQEILQNAIRNEITNKIISTHLHASDYSLDVEKHLQFITMNNKTKIAEAMYKHHDEIMKMYKTVNPTMSLNPVIYENTISEIKSFLAIKCNLTNAEMEQLSSGNVDFFKTNDFHQLIFEPKQGIYATFESVTNLTDLKVDLQDPIKCYQADKELSKAIQELKGIQLDQDSANIKNDGRISILEEYQDFLRAHISENKQAQYLERKQMMELDTEIHLKADYPETKERILLKSENISNMFKKDIDNPYKMFIELERLKSKELENSKEYEIISDTINNPSIKFNINNSNVEILKRANDREELIDYIVDKMGEKSSHKIENLVGQFEEERNKDFSNDKEFLKSLNELPFEKMKMLKDFKEFYNENRFDSMEKIQDNFIDSLDDKKLQSKYNKLFNDEPHIVHKFINANETNVVKDIVNSADNPLVCIAKLEELKVSDSLDMKTSVISDIKDYIAVQSESIKDKIIEQATRKNVETASVLDMEMFKQMIENNGIEARTIIFQDLVNKNTSVVNDKEVVEYIVNEEQRSYCNERKEVLEINFATDEQVSSIEKRAGRSRRGLSKEESKELFKDNFGCLYGVAETRAEHLAQVTFDIKETVDNLNNIYNMMKKHGIEASENSALYKKNTETFVEVNKEILDLISSEKNVRTEIIEVDRALEYNSCTIKYPNKEKLHEKMISIEKEINDREQKLSELKETNYDGKLSLSRLYSNAKSYFANKGNKTLSDNNSEILMIERELDSLRSKYLETQQAYTNSHITIETLKNDIQRENNKIFQEYKEACDILNINTGFIDKLINDMAKRDKDNDAIINVPVTTEFRQSISKLEKGEIQFMDLSNEDISILNKLVDSVREYKLQNENLSQEELHKIININISLDVAETVTQCREKNEFVLLTQYKEELKNLLENREKVTSQEFSQIIDSAYGYSHTTNADIERLNMIYLQCEISFNEVSECRRLLQNLDKSLLEPGTTSSENIVKAIAELNDAIEQHNKNIVSAEETVTNELIAEINKQILVEAGLSHEIRQEILSKYNGEYVNIHYGQDVHKEYMNKVELDSVLAELKSEELREQIKLYKEKEAYQNKIREVIYGKDEHIDNEEPSLDASKQDKEEKKKEEERNKEQEAKIKSREASNDSLQR